MGHWWLSLPLPLPLQGPPPPSPLQLQDSLGTSFPNVKAEQTVGCGLEIWVDSFWFTWEAFS